MEEEKCCCCHHKTKERSEKEYKDLIHRLNRIEGQIRGIKGMVEKDAYCPDILIQVAAANAALNSFNKVLLANHIRTCVAEDIRAGKDEATSRAISLTRGSGCRMRRLGRVCSAFLYVRIKVIASSG